jgi:hypothetical protein
MFSASSEKNNENSDRGGYSATTPRCLARDSHVSAQSASSFRRVEINITLKTEQPRPSIVLKPKNL